MKRIYLDQNIWIALSRARLGRASAGQEWLDAYELAKCALTQGLASFVLSQTHLYETQKRQDWDKRLDVAETMIELSRLHAIAHVTTVVPKEAEVAIEGIAGIDATPSNFFGIGVAAMLSKDAVLNDVPSNIDLKALGLRDTFVRIVEAAVGTLNRDALLLAGSPPGTTDPHIWAALHRIDNEFADDQARVAAKIKALKLKGVVLEEALTQYTLLEVRRELFRAAADRGVPPQAIADLMIAHPSEMLRMMPSRHVVHAMYMQHSQVQKNWKPNDLQDITALGVAVPYCDAVATERHWVDMLRRRKIDVEHNTRLIASADDLIDYLAHL